MPDSKHQPADSDEPDDTLETFSFQAVWQTAELWAWLAIFAMPILYWISGEAVSRDQAMIRWVMIVATVVLATISTIMRLRAYFALR
ncbi:hypothetical protein [Aureliella helgolandensis]|uniref:Uncharacterized protein n=1 Tax=Aureliella helgolandensis TaxID=2527968 RepID=A0A518G0D8_9BACT|nr:hypothetical protein [Aureliella helgolandensis]QDV22072.1 hypothetical protein Q31a_03510 [Aureliella helgolandensis]